MVGVVPGDTLGRNLLQFGVVRRGMDDERGPFGMGSLLLSVFYREKDGLQWTEEGETTAKAAARIQAAKGNSMKASCTLSRMWNGTWLVRHSSAALGTVEVSSSSREVALTKMRN